MSLWHCLFNNNRQAERSGVLGTRKDLLRQKLGTEKEKIREMPKGKAAGYIWTYYKIPIIGIFTAGFLIIYFVHAYLNRPEDTLLHVTFVNCYEDVTEGSEFYRDFIKFAGLQEDDEVFFDSNVFFNLEKESDYANTYFQKTVAYLEAQTTDAVVCQESNLNGLAQGGRVLDLGDERVKGIYEKYKDKIVEYTTNEGKTVPVGIDISDSRLIKGMKSYQDGCYLCISAYIDEMDRIDNVETFLDYLLQ